MVTEKITYRRARKSDLIESIRLVCFTVNHLFEKAGRPRLKYRITEPGPLAVHLLSTDPQGSFVALNEKDKIVGFAMAIIRNDEWYLCYLFVRPSYQTKGIGTRLLQKTIRYGEGNGCKRFSLSTFSYNEQAVALYSRFGMPPQRPILTMTRSLEQKKNTPLLETDIDLDYTETVDEKLINRLSKLDMKARGVRRPEEHFFWLNSKSHTILTFNDGYKLAGYSVVDSRFGQLGPFVATAPNYLASIVAITINCFRPAELKHQMLWVFGEQKQVVESLLKAKFRIFDVVLLMSSEMVGNPDIYVPGNLAHF